MRYFKLEEFTCKCGCKTNKMSPEFLGKLDNLREKWGKPIIVSSGYRCPTHNAKVSSTGLTGPHTTGHAADILISRTDALELLDLALQMKDFTGIGVNQKGSGRFLHLDDLPNAPGQPRPTIWSY